MEKLLPDVILILSLDKNRYASQFCDPPELQYILRLQRSGLLDKMDVWKGGLYGSVTH